MAVHNKCDCFFQSVAESSISDLKKIPSVKKVIVITAIIVVYLTLWFKQYKKYGFAFCWGQGPLILVSL